MKLKLTPRWYHVITLLIGTVVLIFQYTSKALEGAAPITVAGFWTMYGTAIIALFQHNILQPDDDTRNPGILKSKSISPPPMPLSDSGEDTTMKRTFLPILVLVVACIYVACIPKAAVTAAIDLADAECTLDANQPSEPAVESVVCEVIDVGGKIIQLFTVKVQKDEASTFLLKHPLKAGHPNPLTMVKE